MTLLRNTLRCLCLVLTACGTEEDTPDTSAEDVDREIAEEVAIDDGSSALDGDSDSQDGLSDTDAPGDADVPDVSVDLDVPDLADSPTDAPSCEDDDTCVAADQWFCDWNTLPIPETYPPDMTTCSCPGKQQSVLIDEYCVLHCICWPGRPWECDTPPPDCTLVIEPPPDSDVVDADVDIDAGP